MSNVRNVAKNFIVLGLAQVLNAGLSLVLVILITRFVGDSGYGKLGFAMSLAGILTVITPLGLDQLMIREVARHKQEAARYLGNILTIELLLSAVSLGLIAAAARLMHLPKDTAIVLYIAGAYYDVVILSGAMKNIFRANEKMEYDALLNSIRGVVTTGIGAMVLLLGYGLIAVVLAYLASAAIDLLLTVVISRQRFVRTGLRFDVGFWRKIIPLGLPFGVLALLGATYTQIDAIILRLVQSDAVVGWYKSATALVYTFGAIPSILSSAIFPVMSRFHVSSQESLKITVQRSSKYLLILSLPLAVGIALLAAPIIRLFFGADFSPAVPALRILAFFIPFSFLNVALGAMLASVDKQRLRLACYLISTLARIGLNLVLIFYLSLTGAAMAVLISEILLLGLNYYFSARHIPQLNLAGLALKPVVATAAMAAVVFLLRDSNMVLLAIVGATVYFALYLALGGLDATDRAMLRDIWRGVKGKLS